MDQFLPFERLKIFTSRRSENQPQANSYTVALRLKKTKKAHKGNFQEQNDTCANMSSFTFQCGGSVRLGPDVSGGAGTNACL